VIDIHTHILPDIDDGAASVDVSIDMLDAARAMGVTIIVATPHLTEPLTAEYDADVHRAFLEIESHARERAITLLRGFEIRLTPDLPARLRAGEPVTLGGSDTVLVDLPFIDWPHFADETLFNVQASGYQVILAHPERYPRIQEDPKAGLELVNRGIALQVNISSLAGIFGRTAQRAAEALLELGAVHLVASDAHSAGDRMAAVPEGLGTLRDLVGPEGLRRLALDTPRAILRGQPLPAPVGTQRQTWRDRLAI